MREPRQYENPLCAQIGSDIFFPEDLTGGVQQARSMAQRICGKCIHQFECAEWGIKHEEYGIWGGLTASQRRKARRLKATK